MEPERTHPFRQMRSNSPGSPQCLTVHKCLLSSLRMKHSTKQVKNPVLTEFTFRIISLKLFRHPSFLREMHLPLETRRWRWKGFHKGFEVTQLESRLSGFRFIFCQSHVLTTNTVISKLSSVEFPGVPEVCFGLSWMDGCECRRWRGRFFLMSTRKAWD